MADGVDVKALASKPEVLEEAAYILEVNADCNNFHNGNIMEYFTYNNMSSKDEKDYLLELIMFLRAIIKETV